MSESKITVSNRSAFTLIELLTVIAIIGILAAILIPVTARVRDSARSSVCQNNLRQLGVAVNLYLSDNPQSELLPGPSFIYLHPWNTRSLCRILLPYINEPEPPAGSQPRIVEVFVCPAYEASVGVDPVYPGTPPPRPYRQNHTQRDHFGFRIEVFGFGEGALDGQTGYGPNRPPASYSDLLRRFDSPSRVWLITDSHGPGEVGALPGSIPSEPVHGGGTYRNYVFLDGSVRSLPVSEYPFSAGW